MAATRASTTRQSWNKYHCSIPWGWVRRRRSHSRHVSKLIEAGWTASAPRCSCRVICGSTSTASARRGTSKMRRSIRARRKAASLPRLPRESTPLDNRSAARYATTTPPTQATIASGRTGKNDLRG